MAASLLSRAAAGRIGWAARAAQHGCGAPAMALGAFGIAARCNATSSSSSAVSEAAGVHALPRTEPVVSAEWLRANLNDPDVKWRASGYDVESSASGDAILKASAAGEAIEKVYQGQPC
nr:unnamed protein product [Digitaria exilis]